MFRDTTDLTRRVMTVHLVMRNQNSLKVNGRLATLLLVAVTLASSAVTAANAEQLCTHGGQNPVKGDIEQRAASGAAKMSGASRDEFVDVYQENMRDSIWSARNYSAHSALCGGQAKSKKG
jgi:hypothetical protein